MRFLVKLPSAVLLAATLAISVDAAAAGSVVQIDSGSVAGASEDDGVTAYKGIPYAAAPTGANRWREPQPVTAWTGVRQATEYGKACLQPAAAFPILEVGEQSEDCLFLNVWTAAQSASERLPVIVYVHGGSYTSGAGSLYPGSYLARQGAVVVNFNYRLGVFGFLVRRDLAADSAVGQLGNYAIADEIAALRWVKRNITAFGGDPDRVTIAGQSAGADSIARLMVAPEARGLFHRAIFESGAAGDGDAKIDDEAETADTLAARLDCDDAADVIACIRQAPAEDVVAATEGSLFRDALGFSPIVDGQLVPAGTGTMFAEGRQAPVPVLIGSTKDEGKMFVRWPPLWTVSLYKDKLARWFGEDHVDAIFEKFPASSGSQARNAAAKVMAAAFYVTPIRQTLNDMNKLGTPTFQYHFDRLATHTRAYGMGVFHGIELFYLFGWLYDKDGFEDADRDLADAMQKYWVNFAATGDPNSNGLRKAATFWPRYTTLNPHYMSLAAPHASGSNLCDDTDSECDLFDEIARSQQ